MLTLLPIFALYLWKKTNNAEYLSSMYYFEELYASLNENRESRLYPFMFLARRHLLTCVIIFVDPDYGMNFKISAACLIQLCQVGYVIFARPFKSAKDNIGEIMNEVSFLGLIGTMVVLREQSDWNSTNESVFLGFILMNNLLFMVITIGMTLRFV